jgi:hypothetical protein
MLKKKEQKIIGRIIQYLEHQQISEYSLCKELGFLLTFFSQKNREIRTDKLIKILNYFPELSPDWVLFGKGAMLREDEEASRVAITPKIADEGSNDKYLKLLEKYAAVQEKQAMLREKYALLQEEYTVLLEQNVASDRGEGMMGVAAVGG